MRIAVTGSTGYIGGRLVPQLLAQGHDVVCLARTPGKLDDLPWRPDVDVRTFDLEDATTVEPALAGCEAAFYLVHAMGASADFAEADRLAAERFATGAAAQGVQRIVYLGGLGSDDDLSKHLSSRHEVGQVLAAGAVPVTEFRAAVVIGSGSVSFEMLRHLTEVLPVMTTPRWVETRCQPISIRDVLNYLIAGLDDEPGSHIYEIGGPDVVTYRQMMHAYADAAGLRRRAIIPVPVLSPRLSSLWIGLVTPLPVGVARPLVDSLRNEVVVHDDSAKRFGIEPAPLQLAIARALERDALLDVPSRWSDASSSPALPIPSDPAWAGSALRADHQEVRTTASREDLFWAFSRVGGDVGYYGFEWAWWARGILDVMVGGVGLRRGRRHPEEVRLHDTIDFWRVSSVQRDDHLQLAAEMRLPGEAWLEWRISDEGDTRVLEQTASFRPKGLMGRLYWLVVLPFHTLIFGNMARGVARVAEGRSA